jgi:hypothetical protein
VDLPYSENLGSGLVILDIAPVEGCMACGDWRWGFCLVDTNERVDLLTNKPLPFWTGRSDCLKCAITHKWRVEPDGAYAQSLDDPFAK